MTLQIIWFILVFALIGGYAILDGFDLGVGVLHLLARDDRERRISLNAIAPVWDGNEVWLLTGGGALFAAFPPVYATVFSGFYLALMLLMMALIFRAVSIEFRSKIESPCWRRVFDLGFGIGSALPAVLYGVALGNIIRGVPITADHEWAGSFLGLLNWFAVLCGVFSLVLFTMHGAIYLANKTDAEQRTRVAGMIKPLFFTTIALYVTVTVAASFVSPFLFESAFDRPLVFLPLVVLLLGAVLYLPTAAFGPQPCYRRAFLASSVLIAAVVALVAMSLFPRLVPSRPQLSNSLTIYNSSSTQPTLRVMLIIALIGMPLVIAYTALIYRAFGGKVTLNEDSY